MWTMINQVYTSRDAQNAWAHLAGTNAWHKVLPGSADGVTNVHLIHFRQGEQPSGLRRSRRRRQHRPGLHVVVSASTIRCTDRRPQP